MGEIFLHNTGKALNASDREGRKLSYITTSNLYWDRFELSSLKEMLFTENEIDKCSAKKGDLLVCEGGDIGRSAIWEHDYEIRIQNHIHRLRGLGHISHRLFMYWFMYMKNAGLIGGKGIGLMGLSSGELDKLEVPLPPLKKQAYIVDILDGLFSAIQKLDNDFLLLTKDIDSAKSKVIDLAIHGKLVPQNPSDEPAIELLKRIYPAFKPSDNLHYGEGLPNGWAELPLYAICEILDSRRKPINSKDREKRVEIAKILYPYYGATGQVGLIDNYVLDGDYLLLGEDGAPFLNRYEKKAYFVSGKIWVNNHAHILKPRINLSYMMYYLNAIQYRPYVTGTTRLKLTQEVMRNIPVLVPPLAEQERIISKIEELFRVIDKIQLDK